MTALRVAGWLLFAAGLGVFAFGAEFKLSRPPASQIGVFAMLAGMLMTAGSAIGGVLRQQMRDRAEIREMEAERTKRPPTTPAA